MGNIFGNIVNLIFVVTGIVIFTGIAVKVFSKAKWENTVVINKRCYNKQIIRKNQSSYIKKEFVVTFKVGNKKRHFEVSELSYNNYRINQKGILTYKGNRLIDFCERN